MTRDFASWVGGVDPNFTLKKPLILALFYCHQTGLWAAQGWSLWPRWGGFLLGTGPKCANFEREEKPFAFFWWKVACWLWILLNSNYKPSELPFKRNADFPDLFYGCSNGGRRWGWHSSLGGLCQQCCRDLGQMVRRGETHLVTWLAVQFEVPTKKNTESGLFFDQIWHFCW